MSERILDRLLVTLDVAVEAFAVLEVRRGLRLVVPSVEAIIVHYVLEGTMHLAIDGADPVVCPSGSIVVVPAGADQAITADGEARGEVNAVDAASMVRDGMLLVDAAAGSTGDLRVVCGIVMASISGSFGLLDRLDRPIVENVSKLAVVQHAFALMLAELAQPGFGARALTGALMKACLILGLRDHFSRAAAADSPLDALNDPRLGRALDAVLDKPADDHTVAALAATAGMSRSSFAREFRSVFQMAPMEFVAKTRLHHAAEMLRNGALPIKAIAGSIGFASRSHFSRAFKDAYGMDPSQFRKAMARPAPGAPRPLRGSRRRFALTEEAED